MSTTGRKIRVAAVGLGWVTTHRHLPAMAESPDYEIVGLVDSHAGRAEPHMQRFGCTRLSVASELDEVDWLDEVDAVTIGTSPFSHHALVTQALSLGKHVLTEKPFAMTVAEGESMVKLAEEKGLILAVVHNFQFASSTQRLERDLERGVLGEVRGVVGWQLGNPRRRLPEWYEDLPLGLYYDESPHLFYLLQRFAPGPMTLRNCHVFPSTKGLATPASIEAVYAADRNGTPVPIRLSLNFESPVSEWHLTVLGDEQMGDIDVFRDIYVRLPNDEEHTSRTVVRTSLLSSWQHWWQHVPNGIKHLTGRMRYGNEVIFARFAEAIRTGVAPADINAGMALTILKRQHELIAAAREAAPAP